MDFIIFIYSIFIVILSYGILKNKKVLNRKIRKYSVLIACRNEEENLPFLFNSLKKIKYDKNLYEVIIVDDVSTDKSFTLLKEFASEFSNVKVFRLNQKDDEYKGKKAALKLATEKANYDIFLFTDADCQPPENWINDYNNFFDDDTGMVVGRYIEKDVSSFSQLFKLISFGMYSATIGLGFPFSCAGGNLAVSRISFKSVGGYKKIKNHVAGDDKALLNLFFKEKIKIRYNFLSPVITFKSKNFYQQQKRRYGKFSMSRFPIQLLSLFTFIFYIYLLWHLISNFSFIDAGMYLLSCTIFWLILSIKHREKLNLIGILYIMIFPYYLIFFTLIGTFSKWSWK